ncbi:MAG TPA: polyprenol phosphomannose-dependent alpha 1,6 mannosyltransferase MptB [Solirubrobacteraceae bacterium]|nr:polyprenol phosphomannose-dependent alpha 1,6 mannosyltransferase MptB [Solirubrobacteraceae bacterium]
MSTLNAPLAATRNGAVEFAPEALELQDRTSRSRSGLFALGGLTLTVLVVCVCAAQTHLLLPEPVRLWVPAQLAGAFGSVGPGLGSGALIAVLALMFVAYVVAVRHATLLSARAVIGTIIALHALVLLAPPLVSSDVFSYQAYARMFAQYGANPYLHGPHAFALDPIYQFIESKWVNMPSAYGPVFTALSALLAPLSIAAGVLAYKGIAAVSSLVVIALTWQTARLRGLDPIRAVALVGLNPLLVVYGVGGGHNDLLMLALVMAGVYFLLRHRDRAGGASIALASAIKLTGGLLGPFALASVSDPLTRRRRRELITGGILAAVATAALAFSMFGTGSLHLLSTLRHAQAMGDWHSIPGFISTRLGLGTIGHLTGILLGGVFVVVFAWLLRRVWRGELDWIDGAAWATAAMLVTASSLLPWYVAWLMPLAALASDRRIVRASLALTGVVLGVTLLGYIPHIYGIGL